MGRILHCVVGPGTRKRLNVAEVKYWADKAAQYIRDWRVCDCGAEVEGKIKMGLYNTECGHAIDCDYYLADALHKHLAGDKRGAGEGKNEN